MIVTADTDIVLIALYVLWDLDVDKLSIESGKGKDKRWLLTHVYAKLLGEETC